MELKKLSEESLTRQPEEVFDILCKLGEGSYGSVFKALHKESKQVLAIKQVPVDTDLQEIIKEISIMQQCDSPYVVKYYGSYFKNTDLWIVMEYCGAGSVLDIMKLRGILHGLPKGEVKPLNESQIATILSDTLKGLEYLHLRKNIHRDIKAGNILLNSEGHAKLADFGVAGQLTDTMAKRNTVIGTPFWMAPEVIQEIGYDCVADIWSLGITALEMAEGKAPYGEIHPMRAIFMIPTKPPPSFNEPDKWSAPFIDLVSRCLVKNPEERSTASELLQHDFIRAAQASHTLQEIIVEAQEIKERLQQRKMSMSDHSSAGTMLPGDTGTLVHASGGDTSDCGTMIQHDTLVPDPENRISEMESNFGTMVINDEDHTKQRGHNDVDDDDCDDDDETMKRHSTGSNDYRPAFLDHFDKSSAAAPATTASSSSGLPSGNAKAAELDAKPADHALLQKQLQQIAGGQPILHAVHAASSAEDNAAKIQKCIAEGDLDFLKSLSYEELSSKMANLDQEMEREIDDLRRRYHAKRQPILDAMDQKRKRQQNF